MMRKYGHYYESVVDESRNMVTKFTNSIFLCSCALFREGNSFVHYNEATVKPIRT
jgi:hypothetical protein